MAEFSHYAAIDPLALIFPASVYVKLIEKFHPHVPKVAEITEAVRGLSAAEQNVILSRARAFGAHAKAVEEAIGSLK